MVFGGIQKVSTIDFPSVLSCVVFTKGCNLDCFYCHNRSIIENSAENISEEDVLSFLEKRKGLLDGVVVSGGEPTIQDDIGDFLSKVRSMGYKLKLDTNGQNPEKVKEILGGGLCDYVAVDIKASRQKYP
ncbi:MAG: anaerobic ribonucleoside-triphosphate reductase activating protein, partial [Oscillospiraceae bacterium]